MNNTLYQSEHQNYMIPQCCVNVAESLSVWPWQPSLIEHNKGFLLCRWAGNETSTHVCGLFNWRNIVVFCYRQILESQQYILLVQSHHSICLVWHSLTFWHWSFTFNLNKSPTWCNNFSVYYPDVCLQLNMFRAFSRPSSGAQWLQWQPLVLPLYHVDSRAVFTFGPAGRPNHEHSTTVTTIRR